MIYNFINAMLRVLSLYIESNTYIVIKCIYCLKYKLFSTNLILKIKIIFNQNGNTYEFYFIPGT